MIRPRTYPLRRPLQQLWREARASNERYADYGSNRPWKHARRKQLRTGKGSQKDKSDKLVNLGTDYQNADQCRTNLHQRRRGQSVACGKLASPLGNNETCEGMREHDDKQCDDRWIERHPPATCGPLYVGIGKTKLS